MDCSECKLVKNNLSFRNIPYLKSLFGCGLTGHHLKGATGSLLYYLVHDKSGELTAISAQSKGGIDAQSCYLLWTYKHT